MLPVKHYYKEFPDTIRLYINEQSTNQREVRFGWDYDLKEQLRVLGVDIRDTTVEIAKVRDHLSRVLKASRYIQDRAERQLQLAATPKMRQQYLDKMTAAIEAETAQKDQLIKKMNALVQKQFEDAFLNHIKMIYDQCKETRGLEKKRELLKLKRFFLQHRIMENADKTFGRIIKRVKNFSFKIPHFTEPID